MNDHKAFVSGLPQGTVAELTQTNDRTGLLHLAGHVGVIIGLAVWIMQGWLFWPVAILFQGIAICFLFTLEHEATHKTPFATLWLNEWTGRIAGFVLLNPFEWFRYFHLAHHRHTNDPDRDPELAGGGKPETIWAYGWHVTGLPTWASLAKITVQNALGVGFEDYIPKRAIPRITHEARVMLICYAAALASLLVTPVLFWVWLLPAVLGQPFLRLYLLAEHGRCAFVSNMLENTRTTYTNRIIRFFAWNMPYHIEHHTLPMVPFHHLPALNALMKHHHGVVSNGYAEFHKEFARDLT